MGAFVGAMYASGLTAEEMEKMLADYYELRGWNPKGIPV